MSKFKAAGEDAGKRLDVFLAENIPDQSRSAIQKLIKNGSVQYAGKIVKSPKTPVAEGHTAEISIPEKIENPLPQPEDISLDIIYEDDDIMVINKTPDMVVHPAPGAEKGTVVNALLAHIANFADKFDDKSRPGIVHRLDKETSGCLLIAKDQITLERLISFFKRHKIKKTYIALVSGHLKKKKATISKNIGRHPGNRKKMAIVNDGGKEAVTHYEVINELIIDNRPVSYLKIDLETGRTHQIRVHLASIHHPVLGDKIYGGNQKLEFPRQMLHAWKLKITHPTTRDEREFTAPIPDNWEGWAEE